MKEGLTLEAEIPMEEINKLVESGKRAVSRAVELMAIEVWGNIGREAPTDTGRLAGSFELSQIEELAWCITTMVGYAPYVHEGTEPHEIRPVRAKALFWEGAEHPVKKVDHPGTRPNPFVDRALQGAESRSEEFARRAIEELT